MGDGGVLGVLGSYSSKFYMTLSFLGLGNSANRCAVANLGGVGQVKFKIVPHRQPICHSEHART